MLWTVEMIEKQVRNATYTTVWVWVPEQKYFIKGHLDGRNLNFIITSNLILFVNFNRFNPTFNLA